MGWDCFESFNSQVDIKWDANTFHSIRRFTKLTISSLNWSLPTLTFWVYFNWNVFSQKKTDPELHTSNFLVRITNDNKSTPRFTRASEIVQAKFEELESSLNSQKGTNKELRIRPSQLRIFTRILIKIFKDTDRNSPQCDPEVNLARNETQLDSNSYQG